MTWGGDQPSDFWSLRTLVAATLTAAASGISNWSHDIGGYLGERLVSRCPKELLLRWVQFGCFTPLMHAHGRFEQEPWTYDEETLDVYRAFVLLHERLVPYVRAAALTASRCGLPIVRPGRLGRWRLDAGRRVRLRAVAVRRAGLEAGAREREVTLPAGEWIDFWSEEPSGHGRRGRAAVSDPRLGPARGADRHLSRVARRARAGRHARVVAPLEATLWGSRRAAAPSRGSPTAPSIRSTRGEWSVSGARDDVEFREPNQPSRSNQPMPTGYSQHPPVAGPFC